MGILDTDTKQEKKPFRISDVYTAAFLALSNLSYTLEKQNGKILFCFMPSPDLYRLLQAFNEGTQVNVEEFTRAVKRLRAIMLEAKRDYGNGYGEGNVKERK
jgi:hypothetical protein